MLILNNFNLHIMRVQEIEHTHSKNWRYNVLDLSGMFMNKILVLIISTMTAPNYIPLYLLAETVTRSRCNATQDIF